MSDEATSCTTRREIRLDGRPERLTTGATVLVAGADDPSTDAVTLQLLSEFGQSTDTAAVVTTTESVEQTTETYDTLIPDTNQPSLSVVDMISKRQSMSVMYGDRPAVFTASPGDIERLVVALSDLSVETPPGTGDHHLSVRSLTPILETTSTELVSRTLERIIDFRSETGLCLLGIKYTAHDDETIERMADHVDGILWVQFSGPNELELEFRPATDHFTTS